MKSRGFTDKLYVVNLIFCVATVIISFVAIFMSGIIGITDLSPISVIIPSAFSELAVHTGFVIWKAKAENMVKFNMKEDCSE